MSEQTLLDRYGRPLETDRQFGLAPKAELANLPNVALSQQLPKRMGKSSVQLFRYWAEHSEFVRAAINTRKSQVAGSDWEIGPIDPNKPYPVRVKNQLTELFNSPNPEDGDFRTFAEKVIEDLLTLDAGCVEIVNGLAGRPVQLWPVDAGQVQVATYWSDPDKPRYFWYPDQQERASWMNDEFAYLMQNPRSYGPVGLSPIETLKVVIDAELGGMSYNKNQVEGAAPDGMLSLGEGVRPEQVDDFRAYWDLEIAGRTAMAIVGGSKDPKFVPFKGTNRDMQFLEWQLYLARKIAVVFMCSPQDLGISFDINRANGEVLADQTEDRGLRPLLGLAASAFTRKVVWHPAFGGRDNNLEFHFTRLNMKESLNRASINKLALAGIPWKSVNTARQEEGLPPLGPEFDKLMANTSQGIVTLEDIMTARELVEAKAKSPSGGDARSTGDAVRPTGKPTSEA